MKFECLNKCIERFLMRSSREQNISQSETALFRYFIAETVVAIFLCISLLVISLIMRVSIMVEYAVCLLIILGGLTFTGYFLFKKVEHCMLMQKLLTIAVVVFYTAKMGGLLTSGGIIILGAAPVFKTLVFKQSWKMAFVYLLFLGCIIFLAVFDPLFNGKNLLSASQNKFFFALNFTVIISYIFFFAGYIQRMFSKLEHKEVLRQQEMNKAKNRLYANITHEFRTPLTVILGLADALKNNSSENTPAKADTITRNGKQLLQLVDQLLDLSKLEAGGIQVNKVYGNIIPFLRYIFQLQEYYAQEKNLQFIFESESQSYELDFDPEKITTIVSNLLSNAIKFTPENGKICLKVSQNGNYLNLEIIDNGIGIAPDKLEKIFERFYQVDDQETRREGGAGIGLSLVKELVSLLNGSIKVTSNPGFETVFCVKLPVTSTAQKHYHTEELSWEEEMTPTGKVTDTAEQDTSTSPKEQYRLLLIEDNTDVISYLKSCYSKLFNIEVAKNGLQGQEMATESIPDIIISDVMMPEMDGFQLCYNLKKDYRTSHIPIILLTAKADLASKIQGLEQGADAYVVKPFNQQELLVRINKLLELRRTLYERYANGAPPPEATSPYILREDQFMKKVTACIHQNLADENFDVHVLCDAMAMSKSQLYRKFSALTNMSAAKYIRKLRMQRAKQLLLTASMNITEVSYEVGMKTLSTFSELFKDEFGQSPSEYQNQFNGKHRNN